VASVRPIAVGTSDLHLTESGVLPSSQPLSLVTARIEQNFITDSGSGIAFVVAEFGDGRVSGLPQRLVNLSALRPEALAVQAPWPQGETNDVGAAWELKVCILLLSGMQ
jgi:hypothetical protein